MPYLIIVTNDPLSNRWQIINNVFPAQPVPVVQYVSLSYYGYVPIIADLGTITIRNATNGTQGTGRLIKI